MRWRAERWMKVRHMPSAIAHDPGFVIDELARMLRHTFRGTTLKTWLGLESERDAFRRYKAIRRREREFFRRRHRGLGPIRAGRASSTPLAHDACERSGTPPHSAIVTDYEAYLFGEGHWLRAWEKMGARPAEIDGARGLHVRRLGAERAAASPSSATSTTWDGRAHPLRSLGASGLWETLHSRASAKAQIYKFEIQSRGRAAVHARPIRSRSRPKLPPQTGVDHAPTSAGYAWRDSAWMDARDATRRPRSIGRWRSTKCTPGSWRRKPEEGNRSLTWRELARRARAVRRRAGLHAHRADAGDGASVRRIVGLSGHRLLRADEPVRLARRLPLLRRRVPSGTASA